MNSAEHSNPTNVLVDSHVHLHASHLRGPVYTAACAALTKADPQAPRVLMLTQTARARAQEIELQDSAAGWSHESREAGRSGVVRHATHGELFLIHGLQIITQERLEVLGLGVIEPIKDGSSLPETLAQVRAAGGLPVLPWGVGKWFGQRGGLVTQAVEHAEPGTLLLGDNAGRPLGWPEPKQFRLAQQRDLPVLPGSDPLSIPGHIRRPGRYGFRLPTKWDPNQPTASVLASLSALRGNPDHAGSRTNPIAFVLDQTSIRVRKALGRGGVA